MIKFIPLYDEDGCEDGLLSVDFIERVTHEILFKSKHEPDAMDEEGGRKIEYFVIYYHIHGSECIQTSYFKKIEDFTAAWDLMREL